MNILRIWSKRDDGRIGAMVSANGIIRFVISAQDSPIRKNDIARGAVEANP
jgi:hypothetical protein